jgi:proteasome lid subunit RPN8/RPN11
VGSSNLDAINTAYDALSGLRLKPKHWEQMITQLAMADRDSEAPEEICGLIVGRHRMAEDVYPITNILHSPNRYRMDPVEELRVLQTIEQNDGELLAIYHSHPKGPSFPSETDIAEITFPDAIYLIWAPKAGEWQCRGFTISNGGLQEIPIHVVK